MFDVLGKKKSEAFDEKQGSTDPNLKYPEGSDTH